MNCGIYIIKNKVSGNFYIGSSVDLKDRWYRHQRTLKIGKHANFKLQRAYEKYGLDILVFSVIEYCSEDILLDREQYYIDALKPKYNICLQVNTSLGVRRRPETIEKLKKSLTGRKLSDEHKRSISIGNTGKKMSREACIKISNAQKGENNSMAKLTDKQVISILEYLEKGMTGIAIAKLFDVAPSTISQIKNGKRRIV